MIAEELAPPQAVTRHKLHGVRFTPHVEVAEEVPGDAYVSNSNSISDCDSSGSDPKSGPGGADRIVARLERELVKVKIQLAEVSTANAHLSKARDDLGREAALLRKRAEVLAVRDTESRFDALKTASEHERLRGEHERLLEESARVRIENKRLARELKYRGIAGGDHGSSSSLESVQEVIRRGMSSLNSLSSLGSGSGAPRGSSGNLGSRGSGSRGGGSRRQGGRDMTKGNLYGLKRSDGGGGVGSRSVHPAGEAMGRASSAPIFAAPHTPRARHSMRPARVSGKNATWGALVQEEQNRSRLSEENVFLSMLGNDRR